MTCKRVVTWQPLATGYLVAFSSQCKLCHLHFVILCQHLTVCVSQGCEFKVGSKKCIHPKSETKSDEQTAWIIGESANQKDSQLIHEDPHRKQCPLAEMAERASTKKAEPATYKPQRRTSQVRVLRCTLKNIHPAWGQVLARLPSKSTSYSMQLLYRYVCKLQKSLKYRHKYVLEV